MESRRRMKLRAVSGIVLMLLLASMLTLAFNIESARAEPSEPPVTEWSKTYGGGGGDSALSVEQTGDGGYIAAGGTDSFGAGVVDFWLVKVDANGNLQWNKTYGGAGGEEALSVQQTSDGGYIVAGETYSFGAGHYDFWLVKTDANGNMEWNKTYGGTDSDGAWSVQQASDGGYIAVGYTNSFGAGTYDFWLVKTDASGTMQWNKTYGGASTDWGHSVEQTSDEGYIVAGYTSSFGLAGVHFWLIKTDAAGNMEWNKTYGGTGFDMALSVKQTNDRGCIVAGGTDSFGAGGADVWLIKLAEVGPRTWTVDDDGPADFSSIQEAINSPLVVEGDTIYVYSGTYYENVVVNKTVSLVGENRSTTIIDGNGIGVVVDVTASNMTLSNFTIQNSGNTWPDSGIYLHCSSDNHVANNVVLNNMYGIYLCEISNSHALTGNNVSNNRVGIWLGNSSDNIVGGNNVYSNDEYGIVLGLSDYNVLTGNNVSNNGCGIELEVSNHNILTDNNVYLNNGCGIELEVSNHNTIGGNSVYSNGDYGIWLDYSSNDTITGNEVSNNHVGIYVTSSSDNTVQGNNASDNYYGIFLGESKGNTVVSNYVYSNNGYGIVLDYSGNNTVTGNNVTDNFFGISLGTILGGYCSNNTLRGNVMSGNILNFGVFGLEFSHFINDVDVSNMVDGRPVYYWVNQHGAEVPLNAGYVALINCTEITVKDLTLKKVSPGLLLVSTKNSSIMNNNITNNLYGINILFSSNDNVLSRNDVTTNGFHGIYLHSSSSNTLSDNSATKNGDGIFIHHSSNNTLSGNTIADNSYGIRLWYHSSGNLIYHNNFMNNTYQAHVGWESYDNLWDDGYPSGGNYWSDYEETYPDAEELDGSGVWDTPYVIDSDNQDNYPLMDPWTPAPPTLVVTADLVPKTLHLKSKGKWITSYIELPEDYDIGDIDVSTILIDDSVPAEWGKAKGNALLVKFDRQAVIEHIRDVLGITNGEVTLTITGKLPDGTPFEGSDSIRVTTPAHTSRKR